MLHSRRMWASKLQPGCYGSGAGIDPGISAPSYVASVLLLPGAGAFLALGPGNYSAPKCDGTARPDRSNGAPQCLVGVNGAALYGGPGFHVLPPAANGLPGLAARAPGSAHFPKAVASCRHPLRLVHTPAGKRCGHGIVRSAQADCSPASDGAGLATHSAGLMHWGADGLAFGSYSAANSAVSSGILFRAADLN